MNKVELHRALTKVLMSKIPKDCAAELDLLRNYIEDSEIVKLISVNDDLPSYGEEVLVYANGRYTLGFYDKKDGTWYPENDIGEITDWMSLPVKED